MEGPSIRIGQDLIALVVEVSEGHHHEESIDNESYEIVNFDMEGGLQRGCGLPFRNTSKNTELESLHCRSRDKHNPPMAMWQASD